MIYVCGCVCKCAYGQVMRHIVAECWCIRAKCIHIIITYIINVLNIFIIRIGFFLLFLFLDSFLDENALNQKSYPKKSKHIYMYMLKCVKSRLIAFIYYVADRWQWKHNIYKSSTNRSLILFFNVLNIYY